MSRSAAFFDLDRTLIAGSATFPLALAAFSAGLVRPQQLLADTFNAAGFLLRGADDGRSVALRERILRAVAGAEVELLQQVGERIVPRLAASVLPEAADLLASHARAGDDRIIVSASPQELVDPLAAALGLEGAIGTQGEIVDGRYTGRLARPFVYGAQKPVEIARMAAERGYDLGVCAAYSDAASDLPLLTAVGRPVAVNPDSELRRIAADRGWRIVEVAPSRRRMGAALADSITLLRQPPQSVAA